MLTALFYSAITLLALGALLPMMPVKGGGRSLRAASFVAMVLASVLLAMVALTALYGGGPQTIPGYGLVGPLRFDFQVDRLAGIFLILIAVGAFSVGIYSIEYIEHASHESRKNALATLTCIFGMSMALVVASSNMFTFIFFWELMSLTSFLLVIHDYDREENRKAGLFYLVMTQLSTVFLMSSFFLAQGTAGMAGMWNLASKDAATAGLAFLCAFVGFSIKAGIIPFHKWLPYAHPASPSNVSALMSGVMLKVAVYGLVRFILSNGASASLWWGVLILAAGTLSAVLGVLYALKEHDIKRLLAYHSIENIGIIFIGVGAYMIFKADGIEALAALSLAGALFHTLNHGVFKSLLFMAAGSVVNATGTRNIEEMGGLVRRMPKTALLFFIGAVSISAMPPFNGFASELMIFQALMSSYLLPHGTLQILMIVCLSIFALTSAFAAACFVKAFGITFLAVPRTARAAKAVESGWLMITGQAFLALLCVVLGVFSKQIISSVGNAPETLDILPVGGLLLLAFALVSVAVYYTASGKARVSETWGCGIISQNCRMEYTASGFSEPIMTMFRQVYRTRKDEERKFFDRYESIFKEGRAEIHLVKFFEEYMYMPILHAVEAASALVCRLQNGWLDSYIAYTFVTVLALLIFIGWFL